MKQELQKLIKEIYRIETELESLAKKLDEVIIKLEKLEDEDEDEQEFVGDDVNL